MMKAEPSNVVVLGGTGFLGRRVSLALAAHGVRVVTGTRAPGKARDALHPVGTDLSDRASLERAFARARAVINCVGLYVERGGDTFRSVHVAGARRVAEAAAAQSVARLIHISGIGADPAARSRYIRARGEGEEAVRAAFPAATILRPSVMFTEDAGLFATLARIVRTLPVVPLFGNGGTRLQPAHADDVAEAAAYVAVSGVAAGANPGITYELGGPEILAYREILERLAARAGRRRLFLPLPFVFWNVLARVASVLPNPQLTPDQVALMERDNVVSAGAPGFAELGITPRGASEIGLV